MSSYQQQSPPDEGYSEDPLTGNTIMNTSNAPWSLELAMPDRAARLGTYSLLLPTDRIPLRQG